MARPYRWAEAFRRTLNVVGGLWPDEIRRRRVPGGMDATSGPQPDPVAVDAR